MTYETHYQYDENINLDDKSLYDYVIKMDQLDKYSQVSGNVKGATEQFHQNEEDESKKNNKKTNMFDYMMYFAIAIIIFLFVLFMMRGCGENNNKVNYQSNYDAGVIDVLSPEIGQEYKAIFIK